MKLGEYPSEWKRELNERLNWYAPQRLGTARITHVVSGIHLDMIFFRVAKGEEPDRFEFVHVAHGQYKKSQIIEIWMQQKRRGGKYAKCRVGVLPFVRTRADNFQDLSQDEQVELQGTLKMYDNQKDYLYSRAFYQKYVS